MVIFAILTLSACPALAEDTVRRSTAFTEPETVGRKAEEPQLRVFSKNPLARTQFMVYSRELQTRFRHLLGLYDPDDWTVRLNVFVYGSPNDVHSGSDIQTTGEFDPANRFFLRMNVKLHDRFDDATYREALVRLLLTEQMLAPYVSQPDRFEDTAIRPPDWLVHGFDHTLRHRELGKPSYFFSGFLHNDQLMKVEQIITPNRADGLTPSSLELFRASSAILVGALCGQKNGGESMRGLLHDLGLDPECDATVLIRKHFPSVRETTQGIDKWWALELATLAQQQSFEYYTPEKTEEMLRRALSVSFKEKTAEEKMADQLKPTTLFEQIREKASRIGKSGREEGEFEGTIIDYRQFLGRSDAPEEIVNRLQMLHQLRVRAFPLYTPLIDQYAGIWQRLLEGKTEGIDDELRRLHGIWTRIGQTLERTKDYLNYYEATRFPQRSDAFDSYLEFKEKMNSQSLPPRTDRISTHLDHIEAIRGGR